ncbi:hypothetical protein B0H14DRAFT_3130121 [Mycena olivaceomarginata]|nr:hypothetical protein B0H14DRAFT_3130121 [Mycena olivaceomarginata]
MDLRTRRRMRWMMVAPTSTQPTARARACARAREQAQAGVRARTSKAKAETVLYALKATKAFTELEALLRVRLQSAVGVFDACDDMRMIQRDECGKHSLFLPSIQAGFTRVDPPLRRKVKDVIFVWFWTPAIRKLSRPVPHDSHCPRLVSVAPRYAPSRTLDLGVGWCHNIERGERRCGRWSRSLLPRSPRRKVTPPHPTSPHLEPFKPRDLAGAVVNLMNCVREVRRAVKRTHSSAPHACAPRTRTLRDHGLTHHRVWAEDSRGAPGGILLKAVTIGEIVDFGGFRVAPSNTAPQARTERPPRGAASRVGLRPRQEGLVGERVPVGTCADPLVRKKGCKAMPDAARTDPSPIAAWTPPRWCSGSGASACMSRLKNRSKGNGEGRYTTTRSGIRVDEAKALTKILRRWKRGWGGVCEVPRWRAARRRLGKSRIEDRRDARGVQDVGIGVGPRGNGSDGLHALLTAMIKSIMLGLGATR